MSRPRLGIYQPPIVLSVHCLTFRI